MIIDPLIYRLQYVIRPVMAKYIRAPICLLLFLGTATPAVMAAEFSIVPSVHGGIRYDTNPRHRSSEKEIEDAQGMIFDVDVPMTYRTPTASASLRPRVVRSFYRDDEFSDLEDRDHYLTGSASQAFRRSFIGANYGYTDLSLRTSEFEDNGSGLVPILNDDTQTRWYIQPYWQYQFTPANSLFLNGGYNEIRYHEERASRLFDYQVSDVNASFRHALNARHSVALQARFSKFDSENKDIRVSNDSETNSLSLIYDYEFSEKTKITADIGWARTKSDVQRPNSIDPDTGPFCDPAFIEIFPCEFSSDSNNFVGNLTATRQLETTRYQFVIGQSITPNSNGTEVLRFSVDGKVNKNFTERLSGSLRIRALTQNDVGDTERDLERDYVIGNVRLNYQFARRWSVYGHYKFTLDKEKSVLISERKVRNHYFSIGITFQGDGWRW